MLAAADALARIARGHMKTFRTHLYIGAVMDVVGAANRYFANAEPWKLAKTDPERMRTVLYVTLETLRIAAILLQPVMPSAMSKLLDLLAVAPQSAHVRRIGRRGLRRAAAPTAGRRAAAARARLPALRRRVNAAAQLGDHSGQFGAMRRLRAHAHLGIARA